MHSSTTLGALLLATLGAPALLPAQALDDIRAGGRVRVEVAGPRKPRTLVGTLVSQTSDTLRLRLDHSNEMVAVPVGQVRSLDVSLEQHSGAMRGATTGLVLGMVMGLVVGGGCDCGEQGAAVLVFGGILGGLGTGLGALIGLTTRVDEWSPVIPPPAETSTRMESRPASVTLLQLQF